MGASLAHTARDYPPVGAAGIAYARWDDGQPYGVSEAVYAGYTFTSRERIGNLLGHEIAHGFGWQHGEDGDHRDDLDVVMHGVELARASRWPSSA